MEILKQIMEILKKKSYGNIEKNDKKLWKY